MARRRLLFTACAVAAAVVVSSCGGSGFRYVKSGSKDLQYKKTEGKTFLLVGEESAATYFKVPEEWKLYEQRDVLAVSDAARTLSPEELGFLTLKQRFVGFDSAPKPSAEHVVTPATSHPAGFERVTVLDDDERDEVSLSTLRNTIYPIDASLETTGEASEEAKVEVVSRDDEVVQEGGFHGSRIIFNVNTSTEGVTLTFDQTTMLDETSRTLYVFVVGCEAVCYLRNVDTIKKVVDSWTIKER